MDGHDAFADAGDDRLLGRAADEARSRFERTVTRARTFTPMPVARHGVDGHATGCGIRAIDDLGIDACADGFEHGLAGALDARSIAQARLKSRGMPALSAAMRARTTFVTLPPAR